MSRAQPEIDVTLLLEGTYPYIKGGVSSWVHALIGSLPHLRFAAVFLGSRRQDYGDILYTLPSNLVHLETHFLFNPDAEGRNPIKPPRLPAHAREQMAALHERLRTTDGQALSPEAYLDDDGAFGERAFLYSEAAWDYITEQYENVAAEPSFVDYFWSVRNLHAPLWILARTAAALPPSRLFFSPSTGYAGFLGTLAAQRQERPFVLMEHGIYTKERRIDLMKAEWIHDSRNILQRDPTEISYLRELWVRFFEVLGRQAYRSADPIISLFNAASAQQVRDGADASRCRVVPNGIDVERLSRLRRAPGAPPPPVICLLGRVVPIKDIKTFIRATRILCDRRPDIEAWIVGPQDEDPEYTAECRELADVLDLGNHLRFLGFRYLEDVLPQVGLLVLSSISEGLPLAAIEGFAAGLPLVATEVGACPELVHGRPDENPPLGTAGRIVGLADPEAMAAACQALLDDPAAYAAAARAAVARAERYYDKTQMIERFDALFRERMGDD
ncbi:GT4 family glycosyltransferase PelF [Acidihalobacter prosperus]|uniref:Glycosyltransferase, group 1 n=1 Tax=Acidihalobacter prosperus TaxID=160660 RepID=A0A1A6C1Q2_9GAMM|nr:GT4 family glycosyltransferase PelF [Acidihalobacter prosperus]OBS08492.1 glycosyltransferase, group 1 [Acidihalobacter prosperus]